MADLTINNIEITLNTTKIKLESWKDGLYFTPQKEGVTHLFGVDSEGQDQMISKNNAFILHT